MTAVKLRTDAERLDWLSKPCGGKGRLLWGFPGGYQVILTGNDGQTLRAAIDAAMDQEDASEREETSP